MARRLPMGPPQPRHAILCCAIVVLGGGGGRRFTRATMSNLGQKMLSIRFMNFYFLPNGSCSYRASRAPARGEGVLVRIANKPKQSRSRRGPSTYRYETPFGLGLPGFKVPTLPTLPHKDLYATTSTTVTSSLLRRIPTTSSGQTNAKVQCSTATRTYCGGTAGDGGVLHM